MLRIYDCVTGQHEPRLVLLAVAICLLAAYTALGLLARARAAEGPSRLRWVGAAAVVTGGGVWSTHFVAMLAFEPGLPVGYDLGLTAASVLIAVLVSTLGLLLALRDGWAAFGGAVVGAGVGAMHFTGMAALMVPGAKLWDPAFAHAALAVGIVLGAAALHVAARRPDMGGRMTAAGLLALAICGLHFTAMAALTIQFDPQVALPGQVVATEWIAATVAALTLTIVGVGQAGAAVDHHLAQRAAMESERLRHHVAELEATKRDLEAASAQLQAALDAAAAGSQAKSQFLAAMSHELRTPLNAIIGFAEMLAGRFYGPLGDPRYQEYAQTIVDSGNHLLGLINDILDFTKLEAGRGDLHEGRVDLARVIAEAAALMRPQFDKAGVRLSVAPAADLPPLRADERRLRQVLLNLLSNAVKFTPEGGGVHVAAASGPDGIAVRVADTGIGMLPSDIPKALDPFGQIDSRFSRRYDGTGLGLPLSKRLVELHGGTLSIESEDGVGTTVTVTLPAERVLDREVAA